MRNKPEFITKIRSRHTTYGYSLLINCSFDTTKSKHDYYRGKDYMKNLCKEKLTLFITFFLLELIQLTQNRLPSLQNSRSY